MTAIDGAPREAPWLPGRGSKTAGWPPLVGPVRRNLPSNTALEFL